MVSISFKSIGLERAKKLESTMFVEELEEELQRRIAPSIKRDFERVVSEWEGKPRFDVDMLVTPSDISAVIHPTGTHAPKFIGINEGTAPRTITPKGPKGVLRFQGGYKPASRPGVISSGKWSRFGDYQSAPQVTHQISPRDWDEAIRDKHKHRVRRLSENAIRRGVRQWHKQFS